MHLMRLLAMILVSGIFFLGSGVSEAQVETDFPASDGLTVHADEYILSDTLPYIVLFHQTGSSRGEYKEIAPRFVRMGFNCLAVDLRTGGEKNYVRNITAMNARAAGLQPGYYDALYDIRGAVSYAEGKSKKPIILLGSMFSASLCLVEAVNNPLVSAVIALSPGEYFGRRISVTDSMQFLDKPVYVYSTQEENPYVARIFEKTRGQAVTMVQPVNVPGHQGSAALLKENPESHELWLALMIFLNKLFLSAQ
jgi:dienelactone hydrolase